MALDGKEPVGSMGTDIPLAVLSDQPQHLSSVISNNYLHRLPIRQLIRSVKDW